MENTEEQIIDLQMRLTEQEDTINQLNIAAARQQRKIDDVVGQLEKIQLILKELVDAESSHLGGGSQFEFPPHY